MNGDFQTPVNRDVRLETFTAELARAAYCVALRASTPGAWLDLELDLWKAMADKVKNWEEEIV